MISENKYMIMLDQKIKEVKDKENEKEKETKKLKNLTKKIIYLNYLMMNLRKKEIIILN